MADNASEEDDGSVFIYRGGRAPEHVTHVRIDTSVDEIEDYALVENSQLTMDSNTSMRDADNDCSLDEAFALYGIQREESEKKDENSVSSDCSQTLDERLNSQLFIVRASLEGKILSQFPIEESDSIANHLVENTRCRVSCLEFRSMLQPLSKDKVPARDEVWLRRCMRGILVSSALGGTDVQEVSPEYVYCWLNESHSIKPDDEEVWSFFYGVQRLAAKQDAEACLHYHILNDVNLDFAQFLVETLVFIRSLMDEAWLTDFETECQQHVWIPKDVANRVISRMFTWTETLSVDDLNRKVEAVEGDEENGRVDLFSFLQLLMNEHTQLIKKQTALLRVSFDTARQDDGFSVHTKTLVSMRDVHQTLKAFHEPITLKETTQLYRDAYNVLIATAITGYAPRGITFDSFLSAAKRRGLFTKIRRQRQYCKEN